MNVMCVIVHQAMRAEAVAEPEVCLLTASSASLSHPGFAVASLRLFLFCPHPLFPYGRCHEADIVCIGLQEVEMGTGSVAFDAAMSMLYRDGLVSGGWREGGGGDGLPWEAGREGRERGGGMSPRLILPHSSATVMCAAYRRRAP